METTSTTEQWWYELNGQQIGPITKDEIQSLINEGKLNTESLIWTSGLSEWIKLKNSPLNPNQETGDKHWWYNLNGQHLGPVSNEEIHLLIKAGKLNAESFVWKNGMSSWMPLKHTELAVLIEHVTKDITDQMQNIKKKGCLIGIVVLIALFFIIDLLPDFKPNPPKLEGSSWRSQMGSVWLSIDPKYIDFKQGNEFEYISPAKVNSSRMIRDVVRKSGTYSATDSTITFNFNNGQTITVELIFSEAWKDWHFDLFEETWYQSSPNKSPYLQHLEYQNSN